MCALQMHHQQNSPLVLCDTCPRSFHVMCLELEFAPAARRGRVGLPQVHREGDKAGQAGGPHNWVG